MYVYVYVYTYIYIHTYSNVLLSLVKDIDSHLADFGGNE